MRGRPNPQRSLLAIVDLEERVPRDHLRWRIKEVADAALERHSPTFDRMDARVGRASVPPERLLKASLLIALYSVRSERAFCEELEYNLPCYWFLDMDLMKRSFDATVFTKNRQRLLAHDAGRVLFNEGLLSDEYFSVDGTLIETAASLKSFRSKEGPPPLSDDDPGTPAWTSEMFTRDSPWMWPGKATATAPQPNGGPQTFVCETGTASAAHIH